MPASLMNSGALSPALFGVISALVGVVAGGALTAWQQRAQRKHDAAENTKGRIIQLRREVYVVAVEHHTKAMTSLERRPMVSERDFKEAQAKFFASLFKIQMVGSDRSIVAANVLARLYQEVAAEVDSHCADVRATHVAYEAAQARATAANDRLDAIEHELLSLQPDETGGAHDLRLREQLTHVKRAVTTTEERLSASQRQRSEAVAHYVSETAIRMTTINEASIRLLDCMRHDLSLPAMDEVTRDELQQNRELFLKHSGHQAPSAEHDSSF